MADPTAKPASLAARPAAKLLVAFPQFRVADVVKTAEYYRDVFGFQIGDYFGSPPVFVHIHRDNVVLQIGNLQDPQAGTRAPGGVGCNAYLWTNDVDALAVELRGRKADIVEGPVERQYACRELVVKDLNGLTICFSQSTLAERRAKAQVESSPTEGGNEPPCR